MEVTQLESKEIEILRLLSTLYKQLHKEAIQKLGNEILPLDIGILNAISKGVNSPVKLAYSFGVSKSAITYAVDRLEKKGYVVRVRSEMDRRSITLQITDQGKQLLKRTQAIYMTLVRKKLSVLSEEELNMLLNIATKLVERNKLTPIED
ncbi:hypothetical protein SUSAZ_09130 [Sulfolobus acidocaldarius SUSAZ]|nr:hypothetical protein SUSAZ_09130 [Sulfolobus acidocaldarius SUSAZ]